MQDRETGKRSLKGLSQRAAVAVAGVSAMTAGLMVGGMAATVPVAARTTLTLATYGDPVAEGLVFNGIKAAFEKQFPQYELKIQITPYGDYPNKIMTQVAAGQPPDVFQTWAQYKPTWVLNGMLMDLTSRIETSSVAALQQFIPPAQESVRYNGRIWGTPFDYNAMIWFANVDLLDEAGLPVPPMKWTVADLERAATKIARPSQGIWGTTNPVFWGGLNNLQWTYNFTGHYWLTNDGKDVAVDDAGTAAMLRFWYNLVWNAKAAPPPTLTLSADRNEWAGYVGLWEGWLSYFQQLNTVLQQRQAAGRSMFHWTVLPFPAGPHGQYDFAQGHMWSIPAGNKHPDDAWKLCEWLASRQAEEIFVQARRVQPMRPDEKLWDLWLGFLPDKQAQMLKAWILQNLYGAGIVKNFDYWPSYNDMAGIMGNHLYNIIANQKSIENEMKAAADQMRQILARDLARKK
ncbi:MAG: sugar ABC transporter substrate-binding protein [Limnochordaceae bacterium]|nr:sugar ABC transporter substrate-binding protein [Limnochordaceae bacterium]